MSFLTFFDVCSAIPILLAIGVIFVNGFTDAPNAIASAVCSDCLEMKKACTLCAIFNFLGVCTISLISTSVAKNIFALADFGECAVSATGACFLTIIIFGLISWYFGMPSSESHALVASISGATLASVGYMPNIRLFFEIIFYMIMSCACVFCLSYILSKLFPKNLNYKNAEIAACLATSYMHGAQDGQKFIGILVFLFGVNSSLKAPPVLILLVSIAMGLGTLLGGKRIIKSLGQDLVKLDTKRAFVSDISSSVCMLICSLFGLPVSTGNIKSCSIIGVGYAEKDKINKKTAISIIAVSIITFPVCFALGYILTLIFK